MTSDLFEHDDEPHVTYSVAELAEAINGSLAREFGDGLWVTGEISGWNGRGTHAYFNLTGVDDDGKKVQIAVSLFAYARNRIKPILVKSGLELADGVKVRVFGHLDFFAGFGKLSLKMSGIDPRFTLGDLAAQRDELIRRLAQEGLLERNRGVTLSVAPMRIGLVTSDGSAAWHDFTDELSASGFGFHVTCLDVRVQGETAVRDVVAAIRTFSRHPDIDLVAVVRGGGSRTELSVFDHELIALAIAECAHPVFTGIGHEIERSVADEVAHTASKTPTACAVAIASRVAQFVERSEQAFADVTGAAQQRLVAARAEVIGVGQLIRSHVVSAVDRSNQRLVHHTQQAAASVRHALDAATAHQQRATAAVGRAPGRLATAEQLLAAKATLVRALDPATTMSRGWSITRTADGRTVRSSADLGVGDTLITTFATGTATSRVQETQP